MAAIKVIGSFIALFCTFMVFGQDYKYAYRVDFTDKNQSLFSVNRPEEFLSADAIARRMKTNIAITEADLPVNHWYIDSVVNRGGVFHNASKWFNSAVFYTNSGSFADTVASLSFVSDVALVYINNYLKSSKANQKFTIENKTQIPTDIDYGLADRQIKICNGQILHNQGYWGEGIKIAVLDGGFYMADQIPCLQPLFQRGGILGTYDFVQMDTMVFDDMVHGMSVLSLMAADLEGQMIGSGKGASFWLLRSEDGNSEFPIEEENWIAAAEWADSAGCDIITSSLGYSIFDDDRLNHSYQSMDGKTARSTLGAEAAFARGIFVSVSAGNEGGGFWHYITAPSDGEHVLSVGAVDATGTIAGFSGRGPSHDKRVKPDVCGMGDGVYVAYPMEDIGMGSGTSYSCPLVAGLAACLWQARPQLSNQQLLDTIRNSASIANHPDSVYGYGIADFAQALMSVDEQKITDFKKFKLINAYPTVVDDFMRIQF
jgi:hypothetical protein